MTVSMKNWRRVVRGSSVEMMGLTGIAFALLAFLAIALLRRLPGWRADAGSVERWFAVASNRNELTLMLIAMLAASIALLWFVGTIRRRIGHREDQLFATVFLGSGLILIAVTLTAAAAFTVPATLAQQAGSRAAAAAYPASYGLGLNLTTVIAPRVAAVFMLSLSNLGRLTGAFPKWLTTLSTVTALFLLFAVTVSLRIAWILPTWCLIVGAEIIGRRKHIAAELANQRIEKE